MPFRRLVIPRPPFYSLCRTSFIYNGLSQGQAFPSLFLSLPPSCLQLWSTLLFPPTTSSSQCHPPALQLLSSQSDVEDWRARQETRESGEPSVPVCGWQNYHYSLGFLVDSWQECWQDNDTEFVTLGWMITNEVIERTDILWRR